MNRSTKSSNWPEALHKSCSTSVISIPSFNAGMQSTSGINPIIDEIKVNDIILLRKSFGSIPGNTWYNNGITRVGAVGKWSPPVTRTRDTDVIQDKVSVTWWGSTNVSNASTVLQCLKRNIFPNHIRMTKTYHIDKQSNRLNSINYFVTSCGEPISRI